MGSRPNTNFAYIAGFLDGDGSLMLQIKKRKDGRCKLRFMCTICMYQDSRHEQTLFWMRKIFGIGYISKRKDEISELRINGFNQVKDILLNLLPHIRFKKLQARALYKVACLLSEKSIQNLSKTDLRHLIDYVLIIQNKNYVTKYKKVGKNFGFVRFDPVTTVSRCYIGIDFWNVSQG